MPKRLTPRHNNAADPPSQSFRGVLRGLAATRSSVVSVFSDFARITACCLAVQTREEEYLECIKGYSTDELDQLAKAMGLLITEMENKPFEDVLGVFYTESIASADKNARGEFYTPHHISTMMGRIVLDIEKIKSDDYSGGPFTISDPCCGSGSMILACAQELSPHHDLMRVTLQDVNPVACDMAYINTTLWGIPAQIVLGDTLKAETRAQWKNIHWFRVGEDQRQAALKMLDLIRATEADATQPQPPSPTVEDEAPTPPQPETPQETPPNTPPTGPHEQLGLF